MARLLRVWMVGALAAGLCCGVGVLPLAAQETPQLTAARAQRLAYYADQLLASDAPLRASAVASLTQLSVDYLLAVLARLDSLAAARPPHEEVQRALGQLRRAAGQRRVEEDVDLARGIEPLLARERTRSLQQVIEPLLYLRALEAMDDDRASLALARYAALDNAAWDNELKLWRKRRGIQLLPALLMLRTHESAEVRRFALAQIDALGMIEPTSALTSSDPHLLSRLIRAYVSPPDYAAMPLIVRLAGAARFQVREAARFAIERYGKNAIWQLREMYEELSAQPASKAWDADRTAKELYTMLDRAKLEDADTLLARGMARLVAGELAGMQRDYDLLLTKYPKFAERSKLAPGYAALGGERLAHDDLQGALSAYRRALWLDSNAAQARSWRAQVAFLSAELALTRGVADLSAYDRALALDPQLRAAKRVRDQLTGEQTRRTREHKRMAAAASLVLFGLLAAVLLRGALRLRRAPLPPTAA